MCSAGREDGRYSLNVAAAASVGVKRNRFAISNNIDQVNVVVVVVAVVVAVVVVVDVVVVVVIAVVAVVDGLPTGQMN